VATKPIWYVSYKLLTPNGPKYLRFEFDSKVLADSYSYDVVAAGATHIKVYEENPDKLLEDVLNGD